MRNRTLNERHREPARRGIAAVCLTVLLANSTLFAAPPAAAPTIPSATDADSFLVVDCALPAKVRRLGRQVTYLAPRRPLRTTALDCAIRGGEYTAYDRADYGTALAVWKSSADSGSAEAQYYLGRMFEKGLGVSTPDYTQAAAWYRKAAEQGYAAAQVALGYLYEKGLGVEKDSVQALNWYRKSAGLGEQVVLMSESELAELRAARTELDEKERTIQDLERRLQEMEKQPKDTGEAERLRAQVTALAQAVSQQKARVAQLEAKRGEDKDPAVPAATHLDFGPYYALLIGNGAYTHLPAMPSAPGEAQAVATLLERRFGFKVRVLTDATRLQIMAALNELREALNEKYNLLIFYAGRSQEDPASQRGWWLPVDAEKDSRANWISAEVISDHLDLIPAKHALVLADAAFPAVLTRSSLAQLPRGLSPENQLMYVKQVLDKRSRLVLTASEPPAAPAIAGGRSSFGQALLDALAEGGPVVEASTLHRRIATRLAQSGSGAAAPQFAPMRWANHQGGADFFLVAK